MKKVLIVSRAFPPTNASGAVRVGKLAKYLPEFGWEPIVLTVNRIKGLPETLPLEIDEARVVRTPYFDLGLNIRHMLAGNEIDSEQITSKNKVWGKVGVRLVKLGSTIYNLSIFEMTLPQPIGWYPYAIRAARQIIKKHKFDAIFSSYSPSASHFIASYLQKKTHIPWVAEFRDLWALNPYSKVPKPLQLLRQNTEKRVLKNSCSLVSVSELSAYRMQEMHGKEVAVITNGFDEEDYSEAVPLDSKLTVTYTGTIYPGKRDPTVLFEALKQLQEKGEVAPNNFRVRFFVRESQSTIPPLIRRYGLQDIVKSHEYIPFREVIRKQKESAALLLLEWDNPLAKDTYTGKVFEYLGAQRPILAIGYKGGAIDELLRESGTGILVNRVEAMRNILSCWLEEWHKLGDIRSYWKPNTNITQRYTRREQARQLAKVLEKAAVLSGQRTH